MFKIFSFQKNLKKYNSYNFNFNFLFFSLQFSAKQLTLQIPFQPSIVMQKYKNFTHESKWIKIFHLDIRYTVQSTS